MADTPEYSGNDEKDPFFKPEDFEQYLDETPQPLVMDVEPLRMCSEQDELLANEVIRIVEKTVDHVRAVFPMIPIGRHLQLVTLRKLPGSIFLQRRQTPWGEGAARLYQGIRTCLAPALIEKGIPTELVPNTIQEPEAPTDPSSVLSVDLVVEDDPDSTIVIAPEDSEMTDDGNYPDGALSFYEKSEFHIYGTKWKNHSSPPSPP